jgi:hypothetical protein
MVVLPPRKVVLLVYPGLAQSAINPTNSLGYILTLAEGKRQLARWRSGASRAIAKSKKKTCLEAGLKEIAVEEER